MVATAPSAKGWQRPSGCTQSRHALSPHSERLQGKSCKDEAPLSSVTPEGCWLLIAFFEFSPVPGIRWFCLGNIEPLELDSAFMAATVAVVGGPAPAGTHVAQM